MDPYYRQPPPPGVGYVPPPPGYPQPPPVAAAPYGQPPPYGRPPSAGNSVASCICTMLIVIIVFSCIGGVILYVIFLNVKAPSIDVDYLSVTGLNATTDKGVAGLWEVRFMVRNRDNILRAHYDRVYVKVSYKEQTLGWAYISSFDQESKRQDWKTVKVNSDFNKLSSGKINDINSDKSKGKVEFEVKFKTDVYFKMNFLSGRSHELESKCEDLDVEIESKSNNGKMDEDSKSCDVTFRKKSGWVWS